MEPVIQSTLTCPACGTPVVRTMPTDACEFFYDCEACGRTMTPKTGDCCVFCSYGSVPCPPVQQNPVQRSKSCCGRPGRSG